MNVVEDEEKLRQFADAVRRRIEQKREKAEEDRFLRGSLRGSGRLRAIEQCRKIVISDVKEEVNFGFEGDDTVHSRKTELKELIDYIRTKIPYHVDGHGNSKTHDAVELNDLKLDADLHDTESDQWEWLLNVLSDPYLSESFLIHDRVAKAYEKCKMALHPLPRYRWPVLAGFAFGTMESVRVQVLDTLKGSIPLETFTLNNLSHLYTLLSKPIVQNLFLALDGIANTWLVDKDEEDHVEEVIEDDSHLTPSYIEQSPVPGCYATLAYDEQGRDSYNEEGVRLKYVVLQKGDNEFVGATVRIERNSVLIARIVNGGLAYKSGLLHEGDELLSVNGIELIGKDLNTVCDIMASLQGKIVLLIAPALDPYANVQSKGLVHLRALFTYEPEEDRYLACQELGLPFIKGDIIHVTGRRDPNWWQAYRSDEDHGVSGAIGTLAGLIPSPLYQRQRAILRLQYWLNSGAEDVELEDSSDSDSPQNSAPQVKKTQKERHFFGIKLPLRKTSSATSRSKDKLSESEATLKDSSNLSLGNLNSASTQFNNQPNNTDAVDDAMSPKDQSTCVMNTAILGSIYAGRISGTIKPPDPTSSAAIYEWSAAGPVWGQHGYDLKSLRNRRKFPHRKSDKHSPCLEGLKKLKKNKTHDYYPSLFPIPGADVQSEDDPVGWLDVEVARGFMKHPSLWTYEPVATYIPQPLRRRPLVFVGPAHVGRHQIMSHFIQSNPDRFCSVPIHTTNPDLKSTSLSPYIYITEEEFHWERKQHEFIEWGLFNRSYYGTSKSMVKKLIDEGQVCCISLRPDSLKVIRSTGFMPYVIFISPPERLDDLRILQKKMNLSSTCSDAELKACIEASRKIELRFGHWFDKVIIPETLDDTINELLDIATRLEREPSWIPRYWLKQM